MASEADLKRALVRSIRAQNGVGRRVEDKYVVGWPDLILIPEVGPVFFAEAKLLHNRKSLFCTDTQEQQLKTLRMKPYQGSYFVHAVLIGYSEPREALYIGEPGRMIDKCRYVQRPSRFDSAEWDITFLLLKYHLDRQSCLINSEMDKQKEIP